MEPRARGAARARPSVNLCTHGTTNRLAVRPSGKSGGAFSTLRRIAGELCPHGGAQGGPQADNCLDGWVHLVVCRGTAGELCLGAEGGPS